MSHWAEVVFDGLAGGVIGGIVTAGAVVATIKYDSRSRRADRLDEAVGAAHAATQAWGFSTAVKGPFDPAAHQLMSPALQLTTALIARAKGAEPKLAELIYTASTNLSGEMQRLPKHAKEAPELVSSIQRLTTALGCWFSEPDDIRDGKLDYTAIRSRVTKANQPG